MRQVTSLLGAAVFICVIALSSTASAAAVRQHNQPNLPDLSDDSAGKTIFGSVTFMTDNRAQGFTSSQEDPAVEAELGVIWRSLFAGISVSSVDFGTTTFGGVTKEVADISISYYLGFIKAYRSMIFDIIASYNTNPDAFDPAGELDYFEISVGASKTLHKDLKGGVRVYYSPEFSGETGDNWVFEGSLEKPLPMVRNIKPVLTGVVGYQAGDESAGGFDYWFWNFGLGLELSEHFSLDFRYHDTGDVPTAIACANLCDEAFVASLTFEF